MFAKCQTKGVLEQDRKVGSEAAILKECVTAHLPTLGPENGRGSRNYRYLRSPTKLVWVGGHSDWVEAGL